MTIYIVSEGEYSDWDIVGVFSDRATAETMRQRYGLENPLEVYKVDAMVEETRRDPTWRVFMDLDGNMEKAPQPSEGLEPFPLGAGLGKGKASFQKGTATYIFASFAHSARPSKDIL